MDCLYLNHLAAISSDEASREFYLHISKLISSQSNRIKELEDNVYGEKQLKSQLDEMSEKLLTVCNHVQELTEENKKLAEQAHNARSSRSKNNLVRKVDELSKQLESKDEVIKQLESELETFKSNNVESDQVSLDDIEKIMSNPDFDRIADMDEKDADE